MNTLRSFSKYVSLNVLGMIGLSCYILADTFFVANVLGANGLAALNLSISIYSFINAAGLMLGIGGATRYTILQSQDKFDRADRIFSATLLLGLLFGIIALACGIFCAQPLAILLGADKITLPMTAVYLKVLLSFSPFFITNNIMLAFVRNDGNPGLAMTAMVTGSISNIFLDYLFMVPFKMGIFGAAVATGIAPVISLALLSLHILKKKNKFHFTRQKLPAKQILSIFPLGLSAFITEISSGIVLIIFNLQILKLSGNIGVAAYGIIANISLVCIAIFTGVGQGIQPLASRAYGEQNLPVQHLIKKYALVLVIALAVIFYLIGFCFSDGIIGAFNKDGNAELIRIAKNGIHLYFIGFLFAGVNIAMAAFLSASDKPAAAFGISIVRGLLAILPLALILPYFLGMNGVWLSFTVAEFIAGILTCFTLRPKHHQIQET